MLRLEHGTLFPPRQQGFSSTSGPALARVRPGAPIIETTYTNSKPCGVHHFYPNDFWFGDMVDSSHKYDEYLWYLMGEHKTAILVYVRNNFSLAWLEYSGDFYVWHLPTNETVKIECTYERDKAKLKQVGWVKTFPKYLSANINPYRLYFDEDQSFLYINNEAVVPTSTPQETKDIELYYELVDTEYNAIVQGANTKVFI